MADSTVKSGPATPLPRPLSANISAEHRLTVVQFVKRTGLMDHPRLSTDAKLLFVVSSLCADANGHGSADAVKVALSDPAVVAVARSIIAEVVSR
jgi:hypothetical protein